MDGWWLSSYLWRGRHLLLCPKDVYSKEAKNGSFPIMRNSQNYACFVIDFVNTLQNWSITCHKSHHSSFHPRGCRAPSERHWELLRSCVRASKAVPFSHRQPHLESINLTTALVLGALWNIIRGVQKQRNAGGASDVFSSRPMRILFVFCIDFFLFL